MFLIKLFTNLVTKYVHKSQKSLDLFSYPLSLKTHFLSSKYENTKKN